MIQSTSTSQQFTPFPLSPPDAKPFSVDALFHRAWDRFRSRFVKVLLTQLLGFGLIVLASVGICLVLGLFVLIGVLFHNPLLYLILVPLGLAALLFYIYILLWTNLSYVRILIREDQIAGVWQNMVETKPWIFPYLVFSLLISLFSFGFGYLLFIPSLIWLFWGTFAVFTFLDDRSDGLQPLWRSRQLMKGYFWPVVGRLLLYSIGAYGLILIFSLNRYTSVISFVLSLVVVQPLQIAFAYQMYLELKKMNPVKDKVSGGIWPYLSIVGWVLSIILIVLTSSFVVAALMNWSSKLKKAPAVPVPNYVLPSKAPTPTERKVIKKINSLEEAMTVATIESGMDHADTVKVRGIKLFYTPTYKNWTFDFTTRYNKHQSPTTFANVYSEDWVTVKVNSSGEVSVGTGLNLKDQAEDGVWLYQPRPEAAANSVYLDIAKQKMVGAGLTPGTIIDAEFTSLGVPNDTSGFNSQWKVAIVLSGEESSTNKKSKTFSFMGGNYTEMYDSTVTIY